MSNHSSVGRTRSITRAALIALGMVGCGAGQEQTVLVTIETVKPPAMIAFRDEARGEWRSLAAPGASTFDVTVDGPYRIAIACAVPGGEARETIALYARTPEDEPSLHHRCGEIEPPFELRGRVAGLGEIAVGSHARTGSSSWEFSLPVEPGSFDLVLVSQGALGAERIAIRRDVAITGDTDLGEIDLAQEPTEALIPISFTVSNLRPGEVMWASTLLDTGSTTASIYGYFGPSTARLVPPSVLRATDRQLVWLGTREDGGGGPSSYRAVNFDPVVTGDRGVVALPRPIGPVAFELTADRLTATWASLPEHGELTLRHASYAPGSEEDRRHLLTLSRTFLEATGATHAAIDLREVPGFQSEWPLDPTFEQHLELALVLEGGGARVSAAETIGPTRPAGAPGPRGWR